MADLLVRSLKTGLVTRLIPAGVSGGQTELYWFRDDATRCAGVPKGGNGGPAYWTKVKALIERAEPTLPAAFPNEVLVDLQDRSTPVAFAMERIPGATHTQLVIPAERATQGHNWGPRELREVGLQFARLFDRFERAAIAQIDSHGGNYLIDWPKGTPRPQVTRVDALAFGFHWNGRYFGSDMAMREYLPPEMHKVNLGTVEVPRAADRYSLACLLFPLFTEGGYPWSFGGGLGGPAERVARREFVPFSHPKGTTVPPVVEAALGALPTEVLVLFERAFLGDPDSRPSPREWVQALKLVDTTRAPVNRAGLMTQARIRAARHWVGSAGRAAVATARRNRWMVLAVACTALAWWGVPKGSPPGPAKPQSAAVVESVPSSPLEEKLPAAAGAAPLQPEQPSPPQASGGAVSEVPIPLPGRAPKSSDSWSNLNSSNPSKKGSK